MAGDDVPPLVGVGLPERDLELVDQAGVVDQQVDPPELRDHRLDGARTLTVAADVTDRASVEAAVADVVAELGQVDLLVNNAGLIDEFEVPCGRPTPTSGGTS